MKFTILDKGLLGSKSEGVVTLPGVSFFEQGFQGTVPVPHKPDAKLTIAILPVGPSTAGDKPAVPAHKQPSVHQPPVHQPPFSVPAEPVGVLPYQSPYGSAHKPVGGMSTQSSASPMKIEVTVIEAMGLKHLNHFTGDKPYVVCEVVGRPSSKFETKAATGLDPKWNETQTLDNVQMGDTLKFSILDQGLLGHKTEGVITVPTNQFHPVPFSGLLQIPGKPALLHVSIRAVGAPVTVNGMAMQQPTQYMSSPPPFSGPRVYTGQSGRAASPIRQGATVRTASPIRVSAPQPYAYPPQQQQPPYAMQQMPQQQQPMFMSQQQAPRVSISSARPTGGAERTAAPIYLQQPMSNMASYASAPTAASTMQMPPGYTATPAPHSYVSGANSYVSAAPTYGSPAVTVRPSVSAPQMTYSLPQVSGNRTPLAPYVFPTSQVSGGNAPAQYMTQAPRYTSQNQGASVLVEPPAPGFAYGQAAQVTSPYMRTAPATTGSVVMTAGMSSKAPAGGPSMFDMIDRNHDGVITRAEFQSVVARRKCRNRS